MRDLPRPAGLTGRAKVAVAVAVAVLVTALVLATLVASVGDLRDGGERATQGRVVSATAVRLERLVVDAESGTRGFVVSGDEAFLRPYRTAQTRIPATYNELVAATDDPVQREQAMRIGAGVLSYLDEWAVPLVALTGERGLEAGRRLVATAEGKSRLDVIRARFEEFAARQGQLQRGRDAAVGDDARRAELVAYAAFAALAALVALGLADAVRRVVARRREGAVAPQTAAARSRLDGS